MSFGPGEPIISKVIWAPTKTRWFMASRANSMCFIGAIRPSIQTECFLRVIPATGTKKEASLPTGIITDFLNLATKEDLDVQKTFVDNRTAKRVNIFPTG